MRVCFFCETHRRSCHRISGVIVMGLNFNMQGSIRQLLKARHENDVLHRHATEGAQDITKTVSCHLAVKFVD